MNSNENVIVDNSILEQPVVAKVKKQRLGHSPKDIGTAWAFFMPFMVLFIAFTIVPVVLAIYLSFTNYTVIQSPINIGLKNYTYLLTSDNNFITAIQNTFAFAICSGPISYIASFIIAWVIDGLKFKNVFSLAFYAPSLCSSIAMSAIWLVFFSPDSNGHLNRLFLDMGWIAKPILWIQEPKYILPIVTIVSIWMGMGNGFLSFLAGFQGLDKQVFESGAIDGVKNKYQELIYLILPMMKPMLLYGAINTITGSLGIFDIVVNIAGFPGPSMAGLTIAGHLNDYAFTRFDIGYASAIAVILFLITFVLGRVVFKVLGSKDD